MRRVHAVPVEPWKGHWILWKQSYRLLWAAMWVLRLNPAHPPPQEQPVRLPAKPSTQTCSALLLIYADWEIPQGFLGCTQGCCQLLSQKALCNICLVCPIHQPLSSSSKPPIRNKEDSSAPSRYCLPLVIWSLWFTSPIHFISLCSSLCWPSTKCHLCSKLQPGLSLPKDPESWPQALSL